LLAQCRQLRLVGSPILVVERQEVARPRDVEMRLGRAMHEAQVAGDLRRQLGWAKQLHRENLETVIVQEIESTPQVAIGEEIAEDDGHTASAMLAEEAPDALFHRRFA